MKLTKRQLKRIIQEEQQKLLFERGSGNPVLASAERKLMTAAMEFHDQYMMVMGMNPADARDAQQVRQTIDNLVSTILGDVY